ncbi:DUF4148 domain-containing protein [Paraburkholderia solisilvae]|uniref:DUF4148 domain-containing protein n=1 Tax=Paraburkholderia solisilvae TaxID=624376 RepID=A0A6J5DEE1_9BURK|nr:DUF4148 domain-containing protein [Paraburkholderia solisilvae]CAB3751542.1 hypothetical protein LMG29739_01314 [Paraburkholderia solisilvae]
MKFARATTLLAALFAIGAPLASQAQTTHAPVTRADVQDDLVRVEQAGYDPHTNSQRYPADVQAAESKLSPQNAAIGNSSYGPAADGTAASGNRGGMPISVQTGGLYQHH